MAKSTLPFDSVSGPISYNLIRKKGQKHINIRVHHDGRVTISAPAHASDERVRNAVRIKQQWIRRHVERARVKKESIDELSEIPLGGILHAVRIQYQPAQKSSVSVASSSRPRLRASRAYSPDSIASVLDSDTSRLPISQVS